VTPAVSVITPTHNRATKLPRLFASLQAQTFRDFEWLVVDDGSVDETGQVVQAWVEEAGFPIRYVHKENGGRHTAVNVGVRNAAGAYCAVIDDDDWYMPGALERLKREWDALSEPEHFVEVQGLCVTPTGEVIGDPYPTSVFDSDYYELNEVLGIRGDRLGMMRTEVMRAFPFPEEFSGPFVDERLVFNRMSLSHRTRGLNEPLGYKEYLAEGISNTHNAKHVEQSGVRLLIYRELLAARRPMSPRSRYKAYANLVRNVLHQKEPLWGEFRTAPSRGWFILALPAGVALHLRDRRQQRRT
jgi:glycosyltransferase involved in cell wall biosynthesis